MTPQCYYFGVWQKGGAGHYLYEPTGRTTYLTASIVPFRLSILDGGLIPSNEYPAQSKYYLNVINGWTIVSFHDYTGDSRPGSNSSFIVEGVHDLDNVLKIAKEVFPTVYSRCIDKE